MSKSLNEVLSVLGDDGQSVGGSVIVRYENKNELVAYHNSEDGGFIVTEKGEEIIAAYEGKGKEKGGKGGKGGKGETPADPLLDPVLG